MGRIAGRTTPLSKEEKQEKERERKRKYRASQTTETKEKCNKKRRETAQDSADCCTEMLATTWPDIWTPSPPGSLYDAMDTMYTKFLAGQNLYHLMISTDFNLLDLPLLGLRSFGAVCSCATKGGSPHYHAIVGSSTTSKLHPKKIQRLFAGRGARGYFRVKNLNTLAHLLNTTAYILNGSEKHKHAAHRLVSDYKVDGTVVDEPLPIIDKRVISYAVKRYCKRPEAITWLKTTLGKCANCTLGMKCPPLRKHSVSAFYGGLVSAFRLRKGHRTVQVKHRNTTFGLMKFIEADGTVQVLESL